MVQGRRRGNAEPDHRRDRNREGAGRTAEPVRRRCQRIADREGTTVDVGTPIIIIDVAPSRLRPPQYCTRTDVAGASRSAGDGLVPSIPAVSEMMPPAPPTSSDTVRAPIHRCAAARASPGCGYLRDLTRAGALTGRQWRRPAAIPQTDGAVADRRGQDDRRSVQGCSRSRPIRKLARDLGIDLQLLHGTGPEGSITRSDVEAAADRCATAHRSRPLPRGGEERIPVHGVRKATAQAMVSSVQTVPHVTEFTTIDVTRSMRAVTRLRELPEFADVKVTPLLLVAKAILLGLERYPMVNSTWDEPNGEIVVKHYVNLGIAAATPRGLVVPNIKNAEALSLAQLRARSIRSR